MGIVNALRTRLEHEMSETFLQRQVDTRLNAWEEAKHLLDTAAAEKRDLTAEERETYDRINGELDERAALIEKVQADSAREERMAKALDGFERKAHEVGTTSDVEAIRALAAGETRSHFFAKGEQRDLYTTTSGSPVATQFYDQLIMLARYTGPMLDPNVTTQLLTEGGNVLQIPSVSAYSAGTAFSQGSSIGESDVSFNTFVSLNAWKYAFLTQLSQELIADSGIDIMSMLAENCANGIGYSVGSKLTVGTGTVEPNGIVTAAGSGITGGTGVSGTFTVANVMDLVYSVDTMARTKPGAGFMANASTISKIRQLQSSGGFYIFSPALSADQRDSVLGYPMVENPHMASTGTGNKSLIFGSLKDYYVRIAGGGVQLDRSDDFAFNQGLVTFRCQIRVDGGLPQTNAIKYFKGAAS